MSIHKRIRDARLAKDMSVNALALALGVSSTAAWNWDHANTTPRPEMLEKIAKVLDVDLLYLSSGIMSKTSSAPTSTTQVLEDAKAALSKLHGVPASKIRLEFSVVA
ncbi:helix-turn-helix domain-containing protein [Brevundimonas sp. FT23028]|uniref:helix-turn-helix domain-containing protein n=1 Tax=Brevundimonas sp. FT23028 TaxID=3393748 RepID=UPI003B589F76